MNYRPIKDGIFKSNKFIFLFVLLIIFTTASVAVACTCEAPSSAKEGLKRASAVFTGKVTKIYRPLLDRLGISGSGTYRVIFEVTRFWKGSHSKSIVVATRLSGEACGFPFKEGKEYLVYVADQPVLDVETGICTGTKDIADAEIEMEELDRLIGSATKKRW